MSELMELVEENRRLIAEIALLKHALAQQGVQIDNLLEQEGKDRLPLAAIDVRISAQEVILSPDWESLMRRIDGIVSNQIVANLSKIANITKPIEEPDGISIRFLFLSWNR